CTPLPGSHLFCQLSRRTHLRHLPSFPTRRSSDLLTFQHRAGVSPYTSPCGFAQTCVFAKQSLGPFHCGPLGLFTLPRHPFSRSYGVILPSSLTRVLPRALEYSSYLPVSVYGTGTFTWLEAFLGSVSP